MTQWLSAFRMEALIFRSFPKSTLTKTPQGLYRLLLSDLYTQYRIFRLSLLELFWMGHLTQCS